MHQSGGRGQNHPQLFLLMYAFEPEFLQDDKRSAAGKFALSGSNADSTFPLPPPPQLGGESVVLMVSPELQSRPRSPTLPAPSIGSSRQSSFDTDPEGGDSGFEVPVPAVPAADMDLMPDDDPAVGNIGRLDPNRPTPSSSSTPRSPLSSPRSEAGKRDNPECAAQERNDGVFAPSVEAEDRVEEENQRDDKSIEIDVTGAEDASIEAKPNDADAELMPVVPTPSSKASYCCPCSPPRPRLSKATAKEDREGCCASWKRRIKQGPAACPGCCVFWSHLGDRRCGRRHRAVATGYRNEFRLLLKD